MQLSKSSLIFRNLIFYFFKLLRNCKPLLADLEIHYWVSFLRTKHEFSKLNRLRLRRPLFKATDVVKPMPIGMKTSHSGGNFPA